MNFLNPYMVWIKVGAILLVLALFYGWGYHTAKLAGSLALQSERLAIANDARVQIEAAQKQAYDADEALRKAQQASPKSRVREVVRENHSDCVRPPAVDKRLRDALREGNKSISG